MVKPQHRTPEHRQARKDLSLVVARGDAWCVEPVCLEELDGRGRWIPSDTPGTGWNVSHDPTGAVILGPSHTRCNTSEGASRRQRERRSGGRRPRRWAL